MGEAMKLGAALVVMALVGPGLGCGNTGDAADTPTNDPLAGYPRDPTREFIVPGGDNAVPEYGREGTVAERRQASRVIQKWMQARAAKDFVEECRFFSRRFIKSFVAGDAEQVSGGKVKTCPQALAYFGSRASGDFKNTLTGSIDSLRVPTRKLPKNHPQGSRRMVPEQGFSQYHGSDGTDYDIPMNREGGKWWVAASTPLNQEG